VTPSASASRPRHILTGVPGRLEEEQFDTLLQTPGVRLQRVISPPAHAMGADEWFDQDEDEFVLVLQGRGALILEGQEQEVVLNPGDYLRLPAGLRHRIAWTDAQIPTIWLALHFQTPAP
jgi:cupin 2 domain-containing protein